jgi:Undecaprenyl-phosphate galactose phosphotransferase WbaP
LQGHLRLGLKPVALLTDHLPEAATGLSEADAEPSPILDHIFQGDFADAPHFAERFPGCYALVVMPASGSSRIREVIGAYGCTFSNVLVVPDLFGMRSLSVTAKDICGVLTLKLDQRLDLVLPRFCKRLFDIFLASSALLLLSPVLLVVCLAVKLGSAGPIFYAHHRIGRNRKSFMVWKFRSMRLNGNELLRAHLEQNPALQAEWDRDHKLRRDPRITAVGRLLRKSSLDELPQLWNVVCGDMSLVGPRPIVDAEIAKYGDCFEQYKRVSPGLTGLWQVSGRNNTTYAHRIRIDNYYVQNWSLSLDIYILLRTMKTILLSEGAY